MIQFYISGASSGIGKALAEQALKKGHKVTNFSRRNTIEHFNYRHHAIDLSDFSQLFKLDFVADRKAEKLVLINNAGWIGEIKPLGKLSPKKIDRVYKINLIAPVILSKLFIEQTEKIELEKMIVNVSSGAGKHAISGWSTYCSSKAALDMLSRVVQLDYPKIKCFSIAPGIVDTEMQNEIRQAEGTYFPDKQRFIDYKEEGQLTSPSSVARSIFQIIENPDLVPNTVFSIRDI